MDSERIEVCKTLAMKTGKANGRKHNENKKEGFNNEQNEQTRDGKENSRIRDTF